MALKNLRRIASSNKRMALENQLLEKRIALTERTIHNSLNGFVSGLMGGERGMSPLTSFNPTLQNNQYAPITLMWTALMYVYKTHGLVQTAIDMPVLDALRGGLEFSSGGQLSSDDIEVLEDYLEENAILERIGDAFIWTRLFGGGAIIINSEGDCEEPLGDEVMDGKIELYDACRWELTCERRIPKSGMYGYYGKQLDESRVITILGKRAPWLIRAQLSDWGMSEYERMVEDFNLFLRNRNVIYALLEEAKVDVYSLKGFTAQLASSTGTNLTVRRVQAMNDVKSYNNALIMDKEDEYQQKQVTFGGLAEMMKENRMGIASALRMPMSKLFGIPAAGLNSGEDDIENYNGLIESEVRQPMKQVIRKILKLVVRHLFKDDLDVNFKFKPLRMLSAMDEETIKASTNTRYVALYDRMLMNSREMGEALKKDNLVSVPLEAEEGILDDHPVAETAATMADGLGEKPVKGEPAVTEAGESPAPEKPAPKVTKSPLKPKSAVVNRVSNASEKGLTEVTLVREIEVPGFPRTWGLIRVADRRREAGGFKSEAEAREWCPKWGCVIREAR